MKITTLILTVLLFAFSSCTKSEEDKQTQSTPGKNVLLLKVDYTTNAFEGGKEFTFDSKTTTFTISKQYVPPGDFGSIKLFYQELNEPLFNGSIIWNGKGSISFPQSFLPVSSFTHVLTDDYRSPSAGFENVFNPQSQTYNYGPAWGAVQGLVKVREYLAANPAATVKLFLYTPSVGVGNPADWDWILILKN